MSWGVRPVFASEHKGYTIYAAGKTGDCIKALKGDDVWFEGPTRDDVVRQIDEALEEA